MAIGGTYPKEDMFQRCIAWKKKLSTTRFRIPTYGLGNRGEDADSQI